MTHRTPRLALFTPLRVAGGPGRDLKLAKSRITIGTFVGSGEEFKIEDQYTKPRAAHLMLEHAWIGTSEFREIDHEADSLDPSTLADRASREGSDAEAL